MVLGAEARPQHPEEGQMRVLFLTVYGINNMIWLYWKAKNGIILFSGIVYARE
jgi:hypothetical protein